MSDENQQPVFQIQRVYLKDMSLEQPNSPAIFLEQEAPSIEVSLDVGAEAIADGIYESTVTITVIRQGQGQGRVPGRRQASWYL